VFLLRCLSRPEFFARFAELEEWGIGVYRLVAECSVLAPLHSIKRMVSTHAIILL
jgi:hypothetical protein